MVENFEKFAQILKAVSNVKLLKGFVLILVIFLVNMLISMNAMKELTCVISMHIALMFLVRVPNLYEI